MDGVAPLFRREENKNTFFSFDNNGMLVRREEREYDYDYKIDGLWIIVNEYNISTLYDVKYEDLEDKLRCVLWGFTVVKIRSLCKRRGIHKVSGLKKHKLIDAVISWGKKQRGREGELRRCSRLELLKLTNEFGIAVEIPIDIDKVIKDIIEFMDAHKVDWFWIYEIL